MAVVNSPAFHPLPFLQLEENLTPGESNSDVLASSKRLSSNLPLMPFYVQKLTVTNDAQGMLFYKSVVFCTLCPFHNSLCVYLFSKLQVLYRSKSICILPRSLLQFIAR